ncbi:MAG TPA: I78 family peptidase inhibitor [Sphingomicrobium sp.]|nr:I78 family peptidase inhibitor [Sphingomicrobium sp.]
MNSSIAIAASCALTAASCATAEQIPVRGETSGRTCSDANIQQFVGRQATSELAAEMLGVSGADALRWVAHGTMVTMEYRADRLTVYLDPSSRVERLSCS